MAHVLVVEDEKTLNNAYRIILEKSGHTVTSAYNGLEALEQTKKKVPDIILLDLLMPQMGGIEFLEKFNPKKNHPHTVVIILSNLDLDKEIQKAFELGAYKYILKAITSPQQLAVLVEHLISKNISKKDNPDKSAHR